MRHNLALAPHFEDRLVQEVAPGPALHGIPGGQQDFGLSSANLHLVPDPIIPAKTETGIGALINADSIPELSIERRRAASNASKILAQNRHKLHTGGSEAVPTPVDALGTARQAVEIKRKYGKDSPEYQEVRTGLILDSERLLAEAYSKNTAEYFAKVTQTRKADTGEYFSHGLPISKMVRNALTPLAEPEEQDRRVNEYVEEDGTYVPIGNMIGRLGLQETVELISQAASVPVVEQNQKNPSLSVRTVSECTDYAIRDFAINPKGSHGGYAPAVEKFMIRGVHFFDNGDRQEEQVAVPGKLITRDIIHDVLADKGAIETDQKLSKTEVHASQFISVNGEGVMDLVRELDQKASKVHDKNIFMGEEVPEDHPKDYGEFVEDAEVRRAKLAPKPTQLAEYLITLEENGTDSRVAEALVDKFLKATLLEVASKHPEMAEAMFDKATADGFTEVARLDALGKINEARQLQSLVEQNAPEVSYCGAGSCGLDGVEASSPAGQEATRLGLRGKMVRNKEQACKNCSAKELHHDYNGNTVCTSCKSTKLRGQDVKKPTPKATKETPKQTGQKATVSSLDEKRKTSKKVSESKNTSPTEKSGEIVQLRPQPPKQPPAV